MGSRCFAIAATFALALGGCGFYLKGVAKLKPEYSSVYFESADNYSDLHRAVVESLKASGVTLRNEPGGGAVLELSHEESGRRIMSVSVRNVPTEYEVYYNVTYRVLLDGNQVLAPTELALLRVISYDETTQLEKEKEEALIRDALAHDLAERIVRQLAAL